MTGTLQSYLRSLLIRSTEWPVVFAEISDWALPAKFAPFASRYNPRQCGDRDWPLDYLIMNRFFIRNMFIESALAPFDYIARLDTDATWVTPVVYDHFEAINLLT